MAGFGDRALEWCCRAVEVAPDDTSVTYNAACVHARLGLREGALDFLEKPLSTDRLLLVIDNVLLPLSFAPNRRKRATAKGSAEDEAVRLLTRLGLESNLTRGHSAANLSVGQQQRVAAARALIGSPEVIVADEPTSALDRNRQAAFLDLLFTEVAEAGATLIMVSHDESLAPRFVQVMRLDEFATSRQGAGP